MASGHRPDLKDRLRNAYHASLETEIMSRLRTHGERAQATKITAQAQRVRGRAEREHEQKYDLRVKRAMEVVQDEWTRPTLKLRPPHVQYDKFDADDLRRAAEQRVRQRHSDLLRRIDMMERRQLHRLAELPEPMAFQRPQRVSDRVSTQARPVERQGGPPALTAAFKRVRKQ